MHTAIWFAVGIIIGGGLVWIFFHEHCRQLKQTVDSQTTIIRELENRISRQRRSIAAYGAQLRKRIERVA